MATQSTDPNSADVVDQAKDTAQQLAGQVKDKAEQRAESSFDQGKTRVADTLESVAEALRQAQDKLKEDEQQRASRYVNRAADQMTQWSDYLRDADMHDLMNRVEKTARRQPALFLGGVFALGLAGARFLKSSQRNESSDDTRDMNDRSAGRSAAVYRGTYGRETSRGTTAGVSGASMSGTGATGSAGRGSAALNSTTATVIRPGATSGSTSSSSTLGR